jgi:hypothetical protein
MRRGSPVRRARGQGARPCGGRAGPSAIRRRRRARRSRQPSPHPPGPSPPCAPPQPPRAGPCALLRCVLVLAAASAAAAAAAAADAATDAVAPAVTLAAAPAAPPAAQQLAIVLAAAAAAAAVAAPTPAPPPPGPPPATPAQQLKALLALASAVDRRRAALGAKWTAAAGADGRFCAFPGVTCDAEGQVTRVSLFGAPLAGTLPPAAVLQQLPRLAALDLSQSLKGRRQGAGLRGPLPADWRKLAALKQLDLRWACDCRGARRPAAAAAVRLRRVARAPGTLSNPSLPPASGPHQTPSPRCAPSPTPRPRGVQRQ